MRTSILVTLFSALPIPAAPTLTAPASVTADTTPEFTWGAVYGSATYDLQVSTNADFSSPTIDETGIAVASYTPGTVIAATTYYARVRGVNAGGTAGAWSTTLTFEIVADWYVDSVNGDDAHGGQAADDAFLTLAAAATVVQAGQSIGLAKGSSWNEQLALTVDNVTVKSYGTGAKPILDGSDVVTTWAQESAPNTNVYSKASVPFACYDNATWVNVFEDGAYLVRVTSVENCQATPGSYYTAATNPTTPATVYLHPSDSGDPNSNGKVYRVPVRAHGVDAHLQSGITVDGIQTQRTLSQGGGVKTADNGTVRNCNLYYGSSHNVFVGEGGLIEDCTIKYSYYGTSSNSFIVYNKSVVSGGTVTIRRCTIGEDTFNALGVGLYGHNNTSGNFGAVLVEDCTFQNIAVGVSGINHAGLTVNRCDFNEVGLALRGDMAASQYTMNFCDLLNVAQAGKFIEASGSGVLITVNDCTFDVANITNAAIFFSGTRSGLVIEANRCTFTNNDAGGNRYGVWFSGTGITTSSFTMYDCIWLTTGSGAWLNDIDFENNDVTYVGDRNQWATPFSGKIANVTHNSLAAWQAATSQDANSTVV